MSPTLGAPIPLGAYANPKAPAQGTQMGSDTRKLWQSGQPTGSDLVRGQGPQGYPPKPMNSVPGAEYKNYSPAVPNNPPPPAPAAALSALGSVAGPNITKQPALTGPAIPATVTVGQVF